jgi:CelD/BcsL family acetyltransferase involved in cellulose biosynthesis
MRAFDSATAAIASARRAAAAARHASLSFDVELRPLAELAAIAADWRALAARALEPNVFYEPGFALAAAPTFGADVRAGLVWSRRPRQLVGFFPVRVDRRRYGVPFGVTLAWTHPYAPLGTPLVDREVAGPATAAWLDHVAGDAALPDLMLIQLLSHDGPFASTLADVLAGRGCEAAVFDKHERALLLPGESRADYFQRTMSSKRLRSMRRRERRLEQLHATIEEAKDADAIARGLDDYFALESSGWKGRAGTAAVQNEDLRRLMRRAVLALAAEGKVLIHRLRAGGKTIAATIALRSGDTVWGWKVAYDEAYADYSPGVATVAGLTEAILGDVSISRADSCATAADTMAPQLWGERLAMADWLFTAAPGSDFSFGLAARLEKLRRAAIAAAKSARNNLRSR